MLFFEIDLSITLLSLQLILISFPAFNQMANRNANQVSRQLIESDLKAVSEKKYTLYVTVLPNVSGTAAGMIEFRSWIRFKGELLQIRQSSEAPRLKKITRLH